MGRLCIGGLWWILGRDGDRSARVFVHCLARRSRHVGVHRRSRVGRSACGVSGRRVVHGGERQDDDDGGEAKQARTSRLTRPFHMASIRNRSPRRRSGPDRVIRRLPRHRTMAQ